MKAIKQIIDYLRGRGELTPSQLVELASLGFLPWHEVYAEEPEKEELAPVAEEPPLLESEPESELPLAEPIGKRGRGRRLKAADLNAKDLCIRLNEVFAAAESNLAGLTRLVQPLAAVVAWPDAAIALRNAADEDIERIIEEGLRTRRLSLRQLWDFLAEESFRTALSDSQLQGPIGSAYRALLAAPEPANLGRHATLLQHEEVQRVFNLRMAQRKVVRGWTRLYERQPDLIGQVLLREDHWLAYWSMVILYTARRGTVHNRPRPTPHEDWPARGYPDSDRMQSAWMHAAFMDPMTVLPLLQEQTRWPYHSWKHCRQVLDDCLLSLPAAKRNLIDQCSYRLSIAEQHSSPAEPQMVEALDLVEDILREQFDKAGLFLFLSGTAGDPARTAGKFAEELLSWRADVPRDHWLDKGAYPRCCFLCPHNWDSRRFRFGGV